MKPAPPVTSARGLLGPGLAPVIATSEPPVADTCGPDLSRVQGVAAIDEEGRLVHQGGYALQIKLAELLPLGDDYRCMRSGESLVGVVDHPHRVRRQLGGDPLACHRIVAHYPCSQALE